MTDVPVDRSGPLADRSRALAELADETWDVMVVGGGIVGCGVLLDAASRGLRAALVEQDDIASGTSSRSSRLIHGGLRYLEQFRFGLVREALRERSLLLRLAPHLVRLEPVLFPFAGPPLLARAFYGSGLALYDLLGARHDGGLAGHLTRRQTTEWAPALRPDGVRGGIVYHDGVEDDARYALAVARTAVTRGSLVVTRARATGLVRDGGRVTGLQVRDVLADVQVAVRARHVVDATGVWASRADHPLGGVGSGMLPSRGAHIIVRRDRMPARSGMTVRMGGRVLFLVPWPDHWIIGTTDALDAGSPVRPSARAEEVDDLLRISNRAFEVGLTRDDVVGTYAGLRPLIAPARSGSTSKASREHRVTVDRDGLIRVSGGKYTTYRVMAEDVVERVVARDGREAPSGTAELRLIGAADRPALDRLAADLAARHGLGDVIATRLVDRHGTEAADIAATAAPRNLRAPLAPGLDAIEAEVAWAARCELALSLDDVLARRLRLAQLLPDRGRAIAPRVAALMGDELDWAPDRQAREVASYLASADREYGVPPPA